MHTEREGAALVISRREFEAAIFDLDGVLTDTARVHAAAWKEMFDDFLRWRAERQGTDLHLSILAVTILLKSTGDRATTAFAPSSRRAA